MLLGWQGGAEITWMLHTTINCNYCLFVCFLLSTVCSKGWEKQPPDSQVCEHCFEIQLAQSRRQKEVYLPNVPDNVGVELGSFLGFPEYTCTSSLVWVSRTLLNTSPCCPHLLCFDLCPRVVLVHKLDSWIRSMGKNKPEDVIQSLIPGLGAT